MDKHLLSAATWIKSTYSGDNGGDCVEVAPGFPGVVPVRDSKAPEGPVLVFERSAWSSFVTTWVKSSYSDRDGGDCIEVAPGVPGVVPVRDSKAPRGPVLVIAADGWSAFVAAVVGGEFTV
ncbi:DUF397 domain-containing protein [Streptomyces sp. NPDC091266]|uniref:DUF397 domain-containing protein n=1 Tax=Streptomyces sp. NPDC091266 TaxID=3365978 RepID=UPI0038262B7A